MTRTFTFLSDQQLAEHLKTARRVVVYAAPSIPKAVSHIFLQMPMIRGDVELQIIIDADAEAFRHGFGDFKQVKELNDAGFEIRNAPGLRIGVLVIDDQAWVFAPTPEVIFEQPTAQTLNAVSVSRDFAEQILVSIAPDVSVETDELASSVISETKVPEIGQRPITCHQIELIEKDLQEAPPLQFDLERKVKVYKTHYQFVNIELKNCHLGSSTIPISDELLSIVEDDAVRRRLSAKYKLVDSDSKIKKDLRGVSDAVKDLREQFTIMINEDLGRVIARKDLEKFEMQRDKIRNWLVKLTESMETELTSEIEENCRKLAKVLVPIVQTKEPRYLKSRLLGDFSDERKIIDVIVGELMPSPKNVDSLITGMKLNIHYKDITYEMLNDEDFVSRIREMNPSNPEIFEEGPALKAKKPQTAR